MTDRLKAGEVWDYPYLWARQARAGETSGRKSRPSAVALSLVRRDGRTGVVFLAVTSQVPGKGRITSEIPETEKKRAKLEAAKRLWVILDEHNIDVVEKSWYLEPEALIGTFSARFTKQLQAAFAIALQRRKSHAVRRFDDRDDL